MLVHHHIPPPNPEKQCQADMDPPNFSFSPSTLGVKKLKKCQAQIVQPFGIGPVPFRIGPTVSSEKCGFFFWIPWFWAFWWFPGIFSQAGRSSTVHTVHTIHYFGAGRGTPPKLSCQLFSCRIQGQNFMTCAWTWYWTALGGQKQMHIKADA